VLRILFYLFWADFLERTRRYSFLIVLMVTLIGATLLVPSPMANYAALTIDLHRGYYNAAWVGTTVAFSTTFFLALFGFYLIKNTVERDELTGVGQVLAATPLTKVAYMMGKLFSNVLMLMAIVLLTTLATPIMLSLRAEDPTMRFAELVLPAVLIATPTMVLVAALALLFETVPWLSAGLGNVLYFCLWLVMAGASGSPNTSGLARRLLDPFGLGASISSLQTSARSQYPWINTSKLGLGFQMNLSGKPFPVFHWQGTAWPLFDIGARILWVGIALGVTLLAARLFRRFDPSGAHTIAVRTERSRQGAPAAHNHHHNTEDLYPGLACVPRLSALPATTLRGRYAAIISVELRLMLKGVNLWWYLVALGLAIGTLLAPLEIARTWLLPLAAIWPLLLWSPLGSRELRYHTGQLVFTTMRPLLYQLPMCWLAGVLLSLLMEGGIFVRLLAQSDGAGAISLLVGILFVPTLALTLGIWTGTSRSFEILYVLLWYIGPFQRYPYLDFLGVTRDAFDLGVPLFFAGLTVLLLTLATIGRRRQLVGT